MTYAFKLVPVEVKWLAICSVFAAGESSGFAMYRISFAWPVFLSAAVFAFLVGYGFALRWWWLVVPLLLGAALGLRQAGKWMDILEEANVWRRTQPYSARFTLGDDLRVEAAAQEAGRGMVSFRGAIHGLPVKVVASMERVRGEPPRPGEVWQVDGFFSARFNSWPLLRRELRATDRRTSLRKVADAPSPFAAKLRAANGRLAGRIGRCVRTWRDGDEVCGLLRCMILGDKSGMPSAVKEDFKLSGTMHVFAISGLHVMAVFHALRVVASLLLVPWRIAPLAIAPALWFYLGMIGCPPSALRAVLMASMMGLSVLAGRRGSGVTSWAIAFLVCHVFNPHWILDIGSIYSFVIMLAIVLFSRVEEGTLKGVKTVPAGTRAMKAFKFAFIAWAAGVPVSARVFGAIAPGGILAGMFVIPAAFGAVLCEMAAVAAYGILPGLSMFLDACAGICVRFMCGLAAVVSRFSWSFVEVERWSVGACAAWYVALVALLWLFARARRKVFV